jgi:acyl-CoA thioester hydrolase
VAALNDFTFFHPLRVRWNECDMQGIVFNVNDDELEIAVRCARLGRKSCAMAFAAFRGETLLAEGLNTYVAVKRGTTETTPLEPDYVERVLAFEKTAPERG